MKLVNRQYRSASVFGSMSLVVMVVILAEVWMQALGLVNSWAVLCFVLAACQKLADLSVKRLQKADFKIPSLGFKPKGMVILCLFLIAILPYIVWLFVMGDVFEQAIASLEIKALTSVLFLAAVVANIQVEALATKWRNNNGLTKSKKETPA